MPKYFHEGDNSVAILLLFDSLQNVMQWVKVDQATINHYWQLLRGVAIGTVHDEFGNFGRGGKRVEVGVISLGTTTTDGNRREVCKRFLYRLVQRS